MRVIIILILFFQAHLLISQSLERSLVSSAGNISSGSNLQISATVGEPVISTTSATNIMLTQGFQQSYISRIGVEPLAGTHSNIKIYPNPATETVVLHYISSGNEAIRIYIYDNIGRLMFSSAELRSTGSLTYPMDISHYAAGTYFIKVYTASDDDIQIFKVVKIR